MSCEIFPILFQHPPSLAVLTFPSRRVLVLQTLCAETRPLLFHTNSALAYLGLILCIVITIIISHQGFMPRQPCSDLSANPDSALDLAIDSGSGQNPLSVRSPLPFLC